MSPTTKKRYLLIYFLAILSIILGASLLKEYMVILVAFGSLLLLVPWFGCFMDVLNHKRENRVLWILLLLFTSTISIPIYLLRK
jgi:uncharacterized membrane protein